VRWFLAVGFALLIGCGPSLGGSNSDDDDSTDVELDDDDAVASGELVFDPLEIDFGTVLAGDMAIAELLVANGTDQARLIQDVILPDVGNFSIIESPQGSLLEPGTSAVWQISYAPARHEFIEGRLIVRTDDPDQSEVVVFLAGAGSAPAINIDPPSFDFGNRIVGCVALIEITISNIGDQLLTISSIWYEDFSSGDELTPILEPDPGTVIEPGQAVSMTVGYAPQDVEFDSGVLHVFSDDPSTPDASAQQFGVASPAPPTTETFLGTGLLNTFELSVPVLAATLEVSINGVPIFVGWTYSLGLNAVVFDIGNQPADGDTVEITYSPLGVGCDD
jgi:hypothetical protein